MFLARRHYLMNLFLQPNGKQMIAETPDGEIHKVNAQDIYSSKKIDSPLFTSRKEIMYGSNNHLFYTGSPYMLDEKVIEAVGNARFIDTRNVQH